MLRCERAISQRWHTDPAISVMIRVLSLTREGITCENLDMASSMLFESANVSGPLSPGSLSTANHSSVDEPLYEMVDGKRLDLPPMSAYSSWIASRLDHRLGPFAEERSLGTTVMETLFILDKTQDRRRRPDVAFVSTQRWPLDRPVPMIGDWDVVPDLAVEVVSPNDLAADLLTKVREYFTFGVRLVWVIYPEERQVYVYRSQTQVLVLKMEQELDGEDVLPGFRLALSMLFQASAPSTAANF